MTHTLIGTVNFSSLLAASAYYSSLAIAKQKVANGEIEIGKPNILNGEKLVVKDGRYFIQTA